MNEIIFILMILICMISIFCTNKLFPKSGLYLLLTIFLILGFILSFKITTIFGFNVNLNVIPTVSLFSIIYIILTNDNKAKKKIFKLSIITIIFAFITTLLSCFYIQTVSDNVAINMNNLFLSNYRIMLVYPLVIILEEYLFLKLYYKFHNIYESVFITNVTSCILLSLISITLYTIISYITILDIKQIINLILTIYLFKILITVSYIPLMYISQKKVKK